MRETRILSALPLGVGVFTMSCLFFACGSDAPPPETGEPEAEAEATDPDAPGVRQVGPNRYEAVIYAYEGGFDPAEIVVPVGAEVRFRATSRDEPHGFVIEGTDVALDIFPAAFVEAEHTFATAGSYPFLCHVYCGGGHDSMRGRVIVE